MHLNKILDQIKHHPSPTEAIDKLGKAFVTKDFKELDELKAEVKELKQLLQNVTTVRPEVNEKVPQAEEKQIEI